MQLIETECSGELTIFPDKIKIDGDQLQVGATLLLSDRNKQKIIAFYQFETEQEKKKWLTESNVLTATVVGELSIPEQSRNLNGFDYQPI